MYRILIFILFISLSYAQKESLSLSDCIQIALSNKEALKASVLDLESSRQSIKGSYSNILPNLSLSLSGSITESKGGDDREAYDNFMDSLFTLFGNPDLSGTQNNSSGNNNSSARIYYHKIYMMAGNGGIGLHNQKLIIKLLNSLIGK